VVEIGTKQQKSYSAVEIGTKQQKSYSAVPQWPATPFIASSLAPVQQKIQVEIYKIVAKVYNCNTCSSTSRDNHARREFLEVKHASSNLANGLGQFGQFGCVRSSSG
jgi:hypothetical protein